MVEDVEVDAGYLAAQVGSTVALLDPDGEPALDLRVTAVSEPVAVDGWQTWTATFTGPAEPELGQGSFRVRFGDGGAAWLFLVPESADPPTYLATFNQEAR